MSDDDLKREPIRGLPEVPPEGERILWQGAPRTFSLARQALNAYWIAGYFALLALWRGWVMAAEGGLAAGLTAASWLIAIGAVAVGVLVLIAFVMARATVYTITTHRVAMRVGAALTLTLNLPYRWIGSADLALYRDGTGSIVLDLEGDTQFSYLVLWPHVRPWALRRTRPSLRCIAEPERIADLLAEAVRVRGETTRTGPVKPRQIHTIAAE